MGGEGKQDETKAQTAVEGQRKLDRRDVLKGLSTVPALGLFGYAWQQQRQYQQAKLEDAAAAAAAPADLQAIDVALLGAGAQGQVLTDAMLRIPGLRFRAVCDIWKEYNQKRVVNQLARFKHQVNGYEDYREMLDKEKELDAVVIATPDFWHAQHTVDCLQAGKHVYCEKEMSNTVEGARRMVLAARETGRLLQIGHQRRSNPRYLHCYEKLLGEAKLLGRIVTVNGQWNRAVAPDLGAPTGTRSRTRGSSRTVSRTCTSSATGAGTRAWAGGRSWTSARTRSTSTPGSSAPIPPTSWRAGGSSITTRRRTSGMTP